MWKKGRISSRKWAKKRFGPCGQVVEKKILCTVAKFSRFFINIKLHKLFFIHRIIQIDSTENTADFVCFVYVFVDKL